MSPDADGDMAAQLFKRLGSAVERQVARAIRLRQARKGVRVHRQAVELRSTAGYRIAAWVHRPEGTDGPLPAVVLCPGIDDGAFVFVDRLAPIDADEVARLGCVVVRFDPAGRGKSWGDEDFGGDEHQDDVATVVRHLAGSPDVDPDRIGIVTISLGVAMAVGSVANHQARVAWLLDWEGPCDREIITAGGTRMVPAMGHSADDDGYWIPREAVRHVGRLTCPYIRLQGIRDHAQPGELRHARRMLLAAQAGDIPWFQINDHPRGTLPPRPHWLGTGTLRANQAILRKIAALLAVVAA